MENMSLMPQLFSEDSVDIMRRLKGDFGKLLPPGEGCIQNRRPTGMTVWRHHATCDSGL